MNEWQIDFDADGDDGDDVGVAVRESDVTDVVCEWQRQWQAGPGRVRLRAEMASMQVDGVRTRHVDSS